MDTRRCVETMLRHSPGLAIFVVDNGSAWGDWHQLAGLASLARIVRLERNLGYGAGVNTGLRAARSCGFTLAWLLNPDAVPTEGALEALLAYSEGSVALSPRQSTSGAPENTYVSAAQLDGWRVRPVLCTGCPQGFHPVDVVTGTGLLIDIEAARRVGDFDEKYFHYKEEFDLVTAMSRFGRVGLVCGSAVIHRRGGSLNQGSPVATYYRVRNELLFIRKDGIIAGKTWRRQGQWIFHSLRASLQIRRPLRPHLTHFHYTLMAVRDGLAGRYGQFEPRSRRRRLAGSKNPP